MAKQWVTHELIKTEDMQRLEDAAEDNGDSVAVVAAQLAPPYSRRTWKRGDYCIQNGTLWRCLGDIEAPEDWTADHWRAAKISEALEEMYRMDGHAVRQTVMGSTVQFSDAMEGMPLYAAVSLSPQQDLGEYGAMWPGGGGKNLYDAVTYPLRTGFVNYKTGVQSLGSENYMFTQVFIPCENLRGQTITISPEPSGANPGAAFYSADNEAAFISGGKGTALLVPDNASFLRFSVDVGSEDTAMIEVGETATDYAPYENACPITGSTGAEIVLSGKNLFDPSLFADRTADGVTSEAQADGTIRLSGTPTADSRYSADSANILLPAGNYMISGSPLTVKAVRGASSYSGGFTSDGVTPMRLCVDVVSGEEMDVYEKIQIERGFMRNPTAWEPFQSLTRAISFPTGGGTVYGGEIVLRSDGSAVLTVDRAMIDLGALNYSRSTNGQFYAQAAYSFVRPAASNVLPDLLCDILPVCKPTQSTNNDVDFGISLATAVDKRVLIRYNSIADPAELKTALTGHVAVARLVTPIVYVFEAEQIPCLAGVNNLYSPNGDITVIYPADMEALTARLDAQSNLFAHGVNQSGLDVSYKDGILRINGTMTNVAEYRITNSGVMWERVLADTMSGLLALKAGHKYILHGGEMDTRVIITLYTYDDLTGGVGTEYAKITYTNNIAEGAVLEADKFAKLTISPIYTFDPDSSIMEEANTYDHVEIPLTIEDIACE